MATEVSRLLVLGPDHDSRWAVVSKLRELSGDAAAPDATSPDAAVLTLRTKYYRAAVELHVHQVRDNAPEPALQHALHDYEALLCVVDAGQRDSFLHLQRFAKRVVDTLPYDVCLLAAATSAAPRESVQKMEGWCQDNGFEFVDLDAEQQQGDGDDDDGVFDEKLGVERVLEALHCNMWRSMEMNPPKIEQTKAKNAAPEAEAVDKKEQVLSSEVKSDNQVEDKDSSATGDVASTAAEEQDTSTDDSRLQALLQALEIAGGPDTESGDAGDGDDDDDDLDMAEFSALISEVRNVRDQGQSLTDEQRRERAAEVAMKLWSFLGADDEDGGASDSD